MIATTSTNAVSSCPPNKGSVTIMDDEKSKQLQLIQYAYAYYYCGAYRVCTTIIICIHLLNFKNIKL